MTTVRATAGKKTRKLSSKKPLICTVMRVKNEEPYLAHALRSLKALGGPVVLLDDGSTDATPDIARRFRFVDYHRQDDLQMDEGRDRTALYRWALEKEPQWIFTLDGDEVLHETTPRKMLRAVKYAPSKVNVFKMFLAVMASAPKAQKEYWYNGPSPLRWWQMDRMFRVRDADDMHEFSSNFDNNLHCGCVPAMELRSAQHLNAWIKYYGYESMAAVARKRRFYSEHDPANFLKVERMWRERAKQGAGVFPKKPCCRERFHICRRSRCTCLSGVLSAR
jgi:glycosyltransferase involved in cell wall biosynthesis